MALSNILKPNSNDLHSANFTASGDITCDTLNSNAVEAGRNLTLRPTLDGSGGLQGNAHLSFASNGSVAGVPYVSSSASNGEIRFGSNSDGAGIKLRAGDDTGEIIVQGNVTASNLPFAKGGLVNWASGGNTLIVSQPGVITSSKVFLCPRSPPTSGYFTHVIPGDDEFTVYLSENDTNNLFTFNYVVYT